MKKLRKSSVALIVVVLFLFAVAIRLDLLALGSNNLVQIQRFMEVVRVLNELYFEEVDSKELVDSAIKGMLEKLDPHTVYLPKEQVQEVREQFEGEFEGIGIEFIVLNKIPTVVSPIVGSPSEQLGLRPGDQIVKIEGASTYGFTENQVRGKLLGKKGTKVDVQIKRPTLDEPFDLTITRDKIPIYSITTAFMIQPKTGYIRVGRFAKTTNDEFEKALEELDSQEMRRLILDLRGNSGGYLDQAVKMADKFLESGKRIVYTRGRISSSNEDYYSTSEAEYSKLPLIVLLNHGSASASEIVAGAIQDWDRGLIVGETSFGKGLVQNQISLKDGAAIRVTIARYYSPSGRLIQRSYENGFLDYVREGYDELDPNSNADSTASKPVFTTSSGRKVFGGGGISPDIKIKSRHLTASTIKLIQSQILFQFSSDYATKHANLGGNFDVFGREFEIKPSMVNDLLEKVSQAEVDIDEAEVKQDIDFIKGRMKSQIARHLWSSKEFYQMEVLQDEQIREALQKFSEAAKIAKLTLNE